MSQPAAKQGDKVTGIDMHALTAAGNTFFLPLPFSGSIAGNLSPDVRIEGMSAATVGSTADNSPPHTPNTPASFVRPPTNKATILTGSTTVTINGRAAARNGDTALTCGDPVELPAGKVQAFGVVRIG